jgi:hypothetical protein
VALLKSLAGSTQPAGVRNVTYIANPSRHAPQTTPHFRG